MLADYIKKSIANRTSYYADEQALCLHATFKGSMQDITITAEKIYNDFIFSFEKHGMFDCMTNCCRNINVNKLLKTFNLELISQGETCFISDFFLSNNDVKTKKDLKMKEKKLLSIGSDLKYENKVLKQRLEHAQKWSKQYEEQVQQKEIIKKLLHCKQYTPIKYQGMADARCSFFVKPFGNKQNLFKGDLSFRIHAYSLNNQFNEPATYLKNWLKDICTQPFFISGYVCKGNFYGQFDSPQMELFYRYRDGLVELPNGDRFDCKEWIETNYVEGIEWANAFSSIFTGKFNNLERLKNNPGVEFVGMDNGAFLLNFSKQFDEFESNDVEQIYDEIKECLRPGNSIYLIDDLVTNTHDIPIVESTYEIYGDKAYFCRGNFDFLNIEFEDENVNQINNSDYDIICKMLESVFKADGKFFCEGSISDKEICKMLVAAKREYMFPLIICADSPILDYLQEFRDGVFDESNLHKELLYYKEEERFEDYLNKDSLMKHFSSMNCFFAGKANHKLNGYMKRSENRSFFLLNATENPVYVLEKIGVPALQFSKKWYNKYGASPIVIGNDTIEYFLEKPLKKSDALDVALEHFSCIENVSLLEIDEKSVLAYAADLVKSKVWCLDYS